MLTLFDPVLEVEGRHATDDELRLAHTQEHLDLVKMWVQSAATAGHPIEVNESLVVSDASWDAARAAVGCALEAVDAVLDGRVRNAFSASRPPGRDASANAVGGFSLLNAVAVATLAALASGRVRRVAVIEWGGPPGKGTAEILGNNARVRVASLFEETADSSSGFSAFAALASGATGADFARAQDDLLDILTDGFDPDLIIVSAGFDGLATDPHGRLALTPRDYFDATVALRDTADRICDGRLVSVLEGGYDAHGLAHATVQHLRALIGAPPA